MALASIHLRAERDLPGVRSMALVLADEAALGPADQVGFAVASAETARLVLDAGGGHLEFALDSNGPALCARAVCPNADPGPDAARLEPVTPMVDAIEPEVASAGWALRIVKKLPAISAALRARDAAAERDADASDSAAPGARDHAERLAAALDTAGIGICELDLRDQSLTLDDRAAQLLGVELSADLAAIANAVAPTSAEVWRGLLLGSGVDHAELPRKDGTWLAARAKSIRHGDGTKRLVVLSDASRRIERERDLEQQLELEEKLMGIVSHDLRNPLGTLSFALDAVETTATDPQRRPIEIARRAVKRSEAMIRDLLDFTRARIAGRLTVQPQPMDLAATTRQLIADTKRGLPADRILLTTEGELRGAWDQARLEQVITNLLDNALAYAPDEASIEVSLLDRGEEVELGVQNPGPPIPPETLEHIFDPFFRGTHRGASDSLGLGMYIVEQIAAAHGGSVHVASGDQSTRFHLRLPRHAPARGSS